jgi:hypothetical protein
MNDDIRILRDIEQYYSTQIDEMPMNGKPHVFRLMSMFALTTKLFNVWLLRSWPATEDYKLPELCNRKDFVLSQKLILKVLN